MTEIEKKMLFLQQERERKINNEYNVIFYNGKHDNNDDRFFVEEVKRLSIFMYGDVKKTCNKCKELKHLYEFPVNKNRVDGHLNKCLNCQSW